MSHAGELGKSSELSNNLRFDHGCHVSFTVKRSSHILQDDSFAVKTILGVFHSVYRGAFVQFRSPLSRCKFGAKLRLSRLSVNKDSKFSRTHARSGALVYL